jgi:hypothetical protein
VARKYAVLMALVGMLLVLLRGLKDGHGFEATIVNALSWMAALGLIGLLVGSIAQSTIDEAVRLSMEQELAAAQNANANA